MSTLSTALASIFANPTTGPNFIRLLGHQNTSANQVVAVLGGLLNAVRAAPANAQQYAAAAANTINGLPNVTSLGIGALVANLAGSDNAADVKVQVAAIESALVNSSKGSSGLLAGLGL
jgi:hypothetical protein